MAALTKRVIVPFGEDDLRIIEDFRFANRIGTRAAAIRKLIRLGREAGRPELAGVLGKLREQRQRLRGMGIVHAAVFGSVARGEAEPDSDIDILIEFDPEFRLDLFTYAGIREDIAAMIPGADVVGRRFLREEMKDEVLEEAVHAF